MLARSGSMSVKIAAVLLWAATSFAAETTRSPSDLYGPRTGAAAAAATTEARLAVVRRSGSTADTFRYWNQIANDAQGLDHTPVQPGENRVFGEQLGPGRAARALAIVHIAMFDAVNAVVGGYRSYTGLARDPNASIDAAIATAAKDTLIQLYPSQRDQFNALYAEDIARIPPSQERAKNRGIALGNRAATRILGLRVNDGSQVAEPLLGSGWTTSNLPGRWRQDPIARQPIALGAHWGKCKPFVLTSTSQFRTPAPPALASTA